MKKESYYYNCDYCQKEYVPTRRGVQRFCNPSCKSVWHRKNNKLKAQLAMAEKTSILNQTEVVVSEEVSNSQKEEEFSLVVPIDQIDQNSKNEKPETKKMSIAGTSDAAAGSLIASGLIGLFTKEENKPATKGDLIKILSHLDRYQPINNLDADSFGQMPYFDMETKTVVYG